MALSLGRFLKNLETRAAFSRITGATHRYFLSRPRLRQEVSSPAFTEMLYADRIDLTDNWKVISVQGCPLHPGRSLICPEGIFDPKLRHHVVSCKGPFEITLHKRLDLTDAFSMIRDHELNPPARKLSSSMVGFVRQDDLVVKTQRPLGNPNYWRRVEVTQALNLSQK